LARVDSSKGEWLVAVHSIAQTRGGDTLLLGIIVEQNIDDESFRMRRIEAMVDKREANDPDRCTSLLDRIRGWIDSTEGDGFLDLTDRQASH
jgi:hypothetical protein